MQVPHRSHRPQRTPSVLGFRGNHVAGIASGAHAQAITLIVHIGGIAVEGNIAVVVPCVGETVMSFRWHALDGTCRLVINVEGACLSCLLYTSDAADEYACV